MYKSNGRAMSAVCRFFLAMCCILSTISALKASSPLYYYKLNITPTHDTRLLNPTHYTLLCEKLKYIPLYYNGTDIEGKDGYYAIPVDTPSSSVDLIITPTVDLLWSENTVLSIKRSPDVPCTWYELRIVQDINPADDSLCYQWHVHKRKSEEMPLTLPANSLLLLFDPHLVKDLSEIAGERHPAPTHGDIIRVRILPTLELSADYRKIMKALDEALLKQIDLRNLHKQQPSICYQISSAAQRKGKECYREIIQPMRHE